MSTQIRKYFEPRFNHNFTNVRIHTDAKASSLADSVSALAFTVGNDIVFGTGQYQPYTASGKYLLAHELTHVMQQDSSNSNILQRTTPESFRVTGLYENRDNYPDDVFFDFDKPGLYNSSPENDLDPIEAEKARRFSRRMASSGVQDINLYGYASEEGNRTYNHLLAEKRIEAVANLIIDEGYDGIIYHVPLLHKSSGQIDYRFWRSVEMKPDSQASNRTGSTGSHIQPCDQTRQDIVRQVRDRVVPMLNDAVHRLDTYRGNPSMQTDPQNNVRIALDNNFANDHSAATALEVRNRLQAMSDFLTQPNLLTTILKCADDEDPTCRAGGWAAANPENLIVCPVFFTGSGKEEVIVHESAHGSRYEVHDRAYERERVFVFLTRDQAIDNAQSLTRFVFELIQNQHPSHIGPTVEDVVAGCDPSVTAGMGPNEEKVRKAVAWAERWNTYAIFGIGQTYGNTNNENHMRPYFFRWFGRGDRAAMAGIYDRYRQMGDNFEHQLNIFCVPDSDAACAGNRFCRWLLPATIFICPRFIQLNNEHIRIIKIYAALARMMPGVTEAQTEAYPGLAEDYKEHFWGVKG